MNTSSDHEPEIVPVSDDLERYAAQLSAAASLHRDRRKHLPADYAAYMRTMFAEGAEMAVLIADGAVRSLAVYRSLHTSFRGFRFHIDDMVTEDTGPGRDFGALMLAWCERRAIERGCDVIELECEVERPRAHRFYFRGGLTIATFGFTKKLR